MPPEQQEIKPDYSWLQTTPGPVYPEPKKNGRRLLLIAGIAIAVLTAIAALLLILSDKTSNKSVVVDGQVASTDAASTILAAQNFMDSLAHGDIDKTARLVSPTLESELTAATLESYFGKSLNWESCTSIEQQSYEAEVLQFSTAQYDSVRVNFACRYINGWPVVVTLVMRRNIAGSEAWLFGDGSIQDEATVGGTI